MNNHTIRWTIEKITQRLALIEPLVYRQRVALPPFRYYALPDPATPPPLDADDRDWPVIKPNTYWGKPCTDFILRSAFLVPADWNSANPIGLYLPLGDARSFSLPEALAYIDGEPYATCDRHHQEFLLRPDWCDGQSHNLILHGWTGLGDNWNTDPVTRLIMRQCEVVQIDQATRDFIATARVTLGAARLLDVNDPARDLLLNALNDAFNVLDTRELFDDRFYESVAPAHAVLQSGIARSGAPLPVKLTATGHAHIDVAWLWTLDQTRRKAGRTFHTVLRLMEQFPDYHFTQSQPQLYDYVRQDYPALFDAIKQRVLEGRWEPIGGMWVEADCNLSGAESLARQFLLGRTFFRDHFGAEAESPVLWLPDVFGYSAALPQLIKQAGLDYFFTIKIGWNQYNRLPYDSFWWQGLDGTRVLTHFSTTIENDGDRASTYNAPARAEDVLRTWRHFQQKGVQHEVFMTFGYGDGGGGPTREMLENLRELPAFPAMPQVRQRAALDFFRDLEHESGSRLPTWNGELYLEYHRGTYTTQARNKRANRQSEFLLHDAEFLASYATLLDPAYGYPTETFEQAWQLICLNQFHDIIPGSSIGPVYVDSQRQYAEVRQLAATARAVVLNTIADHVGGDVLIINPTSFARSDLALLANALPKGQALLRGDDHAVVTQAVEGGTLLDAGELPPYSVTSLRLLPSPSRARAAAGRLAAGRRGGDEGEITISPSHIENALLRIELNSDGDITRIYDKANRREVLPPGAIANQWQAFEDRPMFWDAWDIDIYYDDKMWLAEPAESIRVVEAGPLRATLEIKRRILNSMYTQRIALTHHSPRLDISTTIDWRERHVLLKVAFPVEVLSPVATYEIQWGNVQRPTHRNTSWDWARFESCAHKWVDLSEGGFGVSLLNDSKYGHDIRDNVIRLSLLRSPTVPDPEADQGMHTFTYSLYPHIGHWDENTVCEAYALNDPLIVRMKDEGGRMNDFSPHPSSFILCDAPNIVIETIKRAEDGLGFIVRLYENQRRRGDISLIIGFDLAQAWRCNLLEENQAAVAAQNDRVVLAVKPFEIITLRLIPG